MHNRDRTYEVPGHYQDVDTVHTSHYSLPSTTVTTESSLCDCDPLDLSNELLSPVDSMQFDISTPAARAQATKEPQELTTDDAGFYTFLDMSQPSLLSPEASWTQTSAQVYQPQPTTSSDLQFSIGIDGNRSNRFDTMTQGHESPVALPSPPWDDDGTQEHCDDDGQIKQEIMLGVGELRQEHETKHEPLIDVNIKTESSPKSEPRSPTGAKKPSTQRERNRLAAIRCRNKGKQNVEKLQRREAELAQAYKMLNTQVSQLKDEVYGLKNMVLAHAQCDSESIQSYIRAAAQKVR
ncbi:hypothetical protein F5Y15DRAFT_412720 [Xylariaceae sp. FL0016]|nr:hypothetical protein F5Y15DRAFT_412720 [Xylariaceae sp. FL0016]